MKITKGKVSLALCLVIMISIIGELINITHAESFEAASKLREQSRQEAITSQKKINTIAEETNQLLHEYRTVLQQIGSTRTFNNHLEQLIEKQNEQLNAVRRQLENTQQIKQQIMPLIKRMVTVLEELQRVDIPFLQEERQLRIQNLKQLIQNPMISLQEKYRRVMEAYQVEMEYGRSIEAYNGEIETNDRLRVVEFLRIGRIALLYRTFNGKENGYWDHKDRKWVELSSEYANALMQGLRIAKQEAPPDLIKIPIFAPENAQ